MTRVAFAFVVATLLTIGVLLTPLRLPPPAPAPRSVPAPHPAAAPTPPPAGLLARYGDVRLRHPHPIRSLAFTPDGKTLAVTTKADPVIRFWDVASGRLTRALRIDVEYTASLTLLAFTPDGKRVVAVRHQSRLGPGDDRKWHEPATIDAETGAVTRWEWGHQSSEYYGIPAPIVSPVEPIAVWPDGRMLKDAPPHGPWTRRGTAVWSVETGRKLRDLPGSGQNPSNGCFSPDGTQVAYLAGKVIVVGPVDGSRPLREVPHGAPSDVWAVTWPRPDRIVALWYNGLATFDPGTGRQLSRADLGGNMSPLAAAGDRLYAKPEWHKDVGVIDLDALAWVPDRVFRGSGEREPVAVSRDGKTLALGIGHAVRLFETATGTPLHPGLDRYPADPATELTVTNDGTTLRAAGGRSSRDWNLTTGVVSAPGGGDRFPGLTLGPRTVMSPDGRRQATADFVSLVVRGDTSDGRPLVLGTYTHRPGCGLDATPRWPIAFTPDNRRLLTWDNGYHVWDLTGRPAVVCRTAPTGQYGWNPTSAAVSPDGRRLAVVVRPENGPGEVGVWEVASAGVLFRFTPPGGAAGCAFTPDGSRLVVTHPDTTLSVWDVAVVEATGIPAGTDPGEPWDRLAAPDPVAGMRAVRDLAARPSDAVTLFRDQFRPAPADLVARLVAALDSPAFADREAAQQELARLGVSAEDAVRRAAGETASAEVRQRTGELLKRLAPAGGRMPADHRRAVRAVEALERAGTPDARRLLAEWATGPGSVRAAEATAAVARLGANPR